MIKLSEDWRRWLSLRLLLCLLATGSVVLGFYLENWYWRLGLLSHFHFQHLVLLGILALTAFVFRDWKMGTCFTGLALICAYPAWPLFFDTRNHTTHLDFTVASINVLTSNPEKQRLLDLVEKNDPDLLLLMEVNQTWMKELEPLREMYPHVLAKPRSDNFGIALFSKHEFEEGKIMYWGKEEVPSVLANLYLGGRVVCFIGTHPVPPMSAQGTAGRDEQLAAVFDYVKQLPEYVHIVLAGDFNTTHFSRSFRQAMAVAGLHNSANGFGLQPTWPSSMPWLSIPIDHVLLSQNLRVAYFEVGEDIGSDHFPLIVGLGFARGQWAEMEEMD